METILKGTAKEVIIGPGRPTVIIGDRISAANKEVANAIRDANMMLVKQVAKAQAQAGADVINVNVKSDDVDEAKILPQVIQAVAEAVSLPISIDTEEPEALAAALAVCPGRPLVNSISCKEQSLSQLLPLAVQRGAAVIGLALGDEGIPKTVEARVELAREVLRKSITAGLARADVILDPMVLPVKDDPKSAAITVNTISQLRRIEAINLTLRPNGYAKSLPNCSVIDQFLTALAIYHGVNCPIINPWQGRQAILTADLLVGQDGAAARYMNSLNMETYDEQKI